jgi:hypothetical protein
MNASPIPVSPPGLGHLHARRCERHSSREAAARCPGCAGFFCRECVVEHRGKLLCAPCINRATAATEKREHRRASLRRTASSALAAGILWLTFYSLGAALLKFPPEFHDGTIWKQKLEAQP